MSAADRHLLFGLLALQNDFISKPQLVAAFGEWVADKSRSLDQILVARGVLSESLQQVLSRLVEQHIANRNGDIEASLKTLTSVADFGKQLTLVLDTDIQASVAKLAPRDPHETTPVDVGQASMLGNRFRIRRPLDKGGLGIVSVAFDTELNREVALKEIRGSFADDKNFRHKFLMEAEVTGGLEHPGIVPVYGLGTSPSGRPYYAMRLIRGDNLRTHIKRFHSECASGTEVFDGSTLRRLLRRFLDICEAIDYAHARSVLHRDLKPGNIMIGKYGETLVVDWGLAKPLGSRGNENQVDGETSNSSASERPLVPASSADGLTVDGSMVGTVAYAPPEQLLGQHHLVTERSDVYGLGAILYDLLTGQPPVTEASERAIQQVCSGNIRAPREINSRIPKPLNAICLKAISTNPDDRYARAQLLRDEVERWLDDAPVHAYAEPWLDNCRRWVRKHRTQAAAIASTVLIAACAAMVLAWMRFELKVERANRLATEVKLSAEELRKQAAQSQAREAESSRQLAVSRASASEYFRQRSAFENLVILNPPGWLKLAREQLSGLREPPNDTDDSAWRRSAELQLMVAEELVQDFPSDDNQAFRPGTLQFSQSGKFALAGQFKASAHVYLRLQLYDTSTRTVVRTYPLSTAQAAFNSLADALYKGKRAAQDSIVDVLISEPLDCVAALTKKGTLAVWTLSDETRPPKIWRVEAESVPQCLAADELSQRLFVLTNDHAHVVDLAATEIAEVGHHEFKGVVSQAQWDARSHRLLIATKENLIVVDPMDHDSPVRSLAIRVQRFALMAERRLLIGVDDRDYLIIDADSLSVLDRQSLLESHDMPCNFTDLSISFDGVYMAVCAQRREEHWCELWNLASQTRVWRKARSEQVMPGFKFEPNSYRLAKLEEAGLSWWSIHGAAVERTIAWHAQQLQDASWSQDGRQILTNRDERVERWQWENERYELKASVRLGGSARVETSANGRIGLATERSLDSGQCVLWMGANEESAGPGTFSPIVRRDFRATAIDDLNPGVVYAVTPSQDGPFFGADTVHRFFLPGWSEDASWNDGGAADIATGRGNIECLALGSSDVFVGLRNGFVHRLTRDLKTLVGSASALDNRAVISCMNLSPDGSQLAIGSLTGDVVVVDTQTLKSDYSAQPHQGKCTSLFWPSDTELVSTGDDGLMRCVALSRAEPPEAWRIIFEKPVKKAGLAGGRLFVLLDGERALRSFDYGVFSNSRGAATNP